MTTITDVEWGGSDKSMPLLSQILPSFYLLCTLKADFGCFVQICPTEGSEGSEGHFPLWIKKKNAMLFRGISETEMQTKEVKGGLFRIFAEFTVRIARNIIVRKWFLYYRKPLKSCFLLKAIKNIYFYMPLLHTLNSSTDSVCSEPGLIFFSLHAWLLCRCPSAVPHPARTAVWGNPAAKRRNKNCRKSKARQEHGCVRLYLMNHVYHR